MHLPTVTASSAATANPAQPKRHTNHCTDLVVHIWPPIRGVHHMQRVACSGPTACCCACCCDRSAAAVELRGRMKREWHNSSVLHSTTENKPPCGTCRAVPYVPVLAGWCVSVAPPQARAPAAAAQLRMPAPPAAAMGPPPAAVARRGGMPSLLSSQLDSSQSCPAIGH